MRLAEHGIAFCNQCNKIQLYWSKNVRFYLLYAIKITLKLHFWCEKYATKICKVVMDVIT